MNKKILCAVIVIASIAFIFATPVNQKLFVIGDSISIHYGPYLEKFISSDFFYSRKGNVELALQNLDLPAGANGGDSRMVKEYLQELLSGGDFHTDIMLVNCGLHDIKTAASSGEKQVNLAEYIANLDTIHNLLHQHGIKMVWINSTPVFDTIHNTRNSAFSRHHEDLIRYNQSADSLLRSRKVPIVDLYSFTLPLLPEAFSDHVHFNETTRSLQAAYIAGFLEGLSK